MLRRLIGEHVSLETRVTSGRLPVLADRGQIEQVITNVVVNARDAMPGGGTVTLETLLVRLDGRKLSGTGELRAGEYAVLAMSDTGTGMSPDVQVHMFEPFFTTKGVGSGTGLGLATSLGIVQQAEGDLTVYSEPGIGTTLRMYLPLNRSGAVADLKPERLSPRGNETILVVEDDPGVRRVAVRFLELQGYHLLEATSGEEALRLLSQSTGPIHLLVSDVVLPGIGGRELSEKVKLVRPEVRILFMTGYTDDVILRLDLLEGHVSIIQKPFTQETLSQKVRETLDAQGG